MRLPCPWRVKPDGEPLRTGACRPEEVDLILVATISSNVVLPGTACLVQKELGAVNAICFDLGGACTGFVLAYNTAEAYLESGIYRTALVIGSESLSCIYKLEGPGDLHPLWRRGRSRRGAKGERKHLPAGDPHRRGRGRGPYLPEPLRGQRPDQRDGPGDHGGRRPFHADGRPGSVQVRGQDGCRK